MVCSCALASDSDFATNNILLMRNCVHFREKWQLVFPARVVGERLICLLDPKKKGNTKKAKEIFLNVFRQHLKERELDEEQFSIEGELRFCLHHFSKKARSSHFPYVIAQNKFCHLMIKQLLDEVEQNIVICKCLADQLFASARH